MIDLTNKDLHELVDTNVGTELIEHTNACKICQRILASGYMLVRQHIEEMREIR